MTIRSRGGLSTKTGTLAELVQGTVGNLIDPTSPSGVQPNGQSSGFTLSFSDEFTGSKANGDKWEPWYPDNSFWNVTVPGGHLSNTNEPQAYHPSGQAVANSLMTFTLRNQSTVSGLAFTSGMISSWPSFSQLYGYFEARMRLPMVDGTWPAFWLYPFDHAWPPEIDIMEHWGQGVTISSGAIWSGGNSAFSTTLADTNPGNWHTYGVWWTAGRVRFYTDGVLKRDTSDARVSNKAMIIFCNLAGDKDNPPTGANLPASADVDYIRVWT